MDTNSKIVASWQSNGHLYTITATPINGKTPIEDYTSVRDYLGRTPEYGLGQKIYKKAKELGVPISSKDIVTSNYSGKVLIYERSFLDLYFHEFLQPEISSTANPDDDDLPF